MSRIRVLVVDDAVVVRRLVSEVLDQDPDLEVVGVAANGRIALARIEQLTPDVVTLDIEMPEMDGLEALGLIREAYPKLPVIMFSTLTERGASLTIDALSLGANDYVTKPANVGSITEGKQQIRAQLIPKIKALGGRPLTSGDASIRIPAPPARDAGPAAVPPVGRRVSDRPIDVVALGVSTGGPNALAAILQDLPTALACPILIVQHMPRLFTKFLADRLTAVSSLVVREAVHDAVVEPGAVWLAPGDHHMTVRQVGGDVRLVLGQEPPENSCRPAVDPLFRSIADVYGDRALGVILTGMGQDGFHGAEALREHGGRVFAQDEASSVVWGMPGKVVRSGLADRVYPLKAIAGAILHLAGNGVRVTSPGGER